MKTKAYIIAEAGVNHNGDINLAKKLVDAALIAGADAVKFQTFRASSLLRKNAPKAEYQKKTSEQYESQYDMIKKLELSKEAYRKLFSYCKRKKIDFLSSPFDIDSIKFLNKLGLTTFKIPSGEITNYPFLKLIGNLKKKVIMSTGMTNLEEVRSALSILLSAGTKAKNITILHCNTEYPTPIRDVNLRAMITLSSAFPEVSIGYSDHTMGTEVAIAAVALGAQVIEKHFTLDRQLLGPDHRASLEPMEFKEMVCCIRNIEKALGNGIKKPSFSEQKNISIARKSIVAKCNIKKGEILSEKNLITKRPADGLSPMRWPEVIGRKAIRNFSIDELIKI